MVNNNRFVLLDDLNVIINFTVDSVILINKIFSELGQEIFGI